MLAVRSRVQYARRDGTPGGDAVDAIVQGLLRHFYTSTSRPEGQRVLGDSSGAVPVGLPLVRLACGQLPMNRSRSSEA